MSGAKEVERLIRDARKAGLTAEPHGWKWHVRNPATGAQMSVPVQGVGRSLSNLRAELRRLAEPQAPMVAATNTTPKETAVAWPIEELIHQAGQQGVRVNVRGGLLQVVGPVEAEPLARLVRDRAPEVIAHLNPPNQEDELMPKIRDMARIATPVDDLASDAQAVWSILREKAKADGDEPGTNAGSAGVLWRGARDRVLREVAPEWDADYRQRIGQYLEQTGHAKCQSRHATPPIWWIAESWNDGGLTVAKRPTPKPAPPKALSAALTDEELLAAITARLALDPHVAAQVEELETANQALRSRVEDLAGQLAEKDARLEKFEAAAAIFRGGAL